MMFGRFFLQMFFFATILMQHQLRTENYVTAGGLPARIIVCFEACKNAYKTCVVKCMELDACPATIKVCNDMCYEQLYICTTECEGL